MFVGLTRSPLIEFRALSSNCRPGFGEGLYGLFNGSFLGFSEGCKGKGSQNEG